MCGGEGAAQREWKFAEDEWHRAEPTFAKRRASTANIRLVPTPRIAVLRRTFHPETPRD